LKEKIIKRRKNLIITITIAITIKLPINKDIIKIIIITEENNLN